MTAIHIELFSEQKPRAKPRIYGYHLFTIYDAPSATPPPKLRATRSKPLPKAASARPPQRTVRRIRTFKGFYSSPDALLAALNYLRNCRGTFADRPELLHVDDVPGGDRETDDDDD